MKKLISALVVFAATTSVGFAADLPARTLHHLVAVVAVLLFVVGVKTMVPSTGAQADVAQAATLNILQIQVNYAKALPELKIHDMTFALD